MSQIVSPAPAAAEPDPATDQDGAASRAEQKRDPYFTGRVQVYPKSVQGPVRRAKWAALVALLAIYYLVPWIRWDRPGDLPDQAVLVDLSDPKIYFFFIEIWPQEIYYLTGLLILGAVGLFLATSLFGRVWCGFACPQTVWTDLYMWVERHIEGDRNARILLDRQPWSSAKATKKLSKHAIWLLIALATGGAWVMYFADAPTIVVAFFTGQASVEVYFFVGLFTLTTYVLAGAAREQVCTYMCPWPRFQAALLDEDSLVVTYRDWRGEPRAKHKKGDSWEGRGDCIDCKACVAACPTGIDIRDGMQLECIGCGLCVDACDDIMTKVGRPKGLVAFDSERNTQKGVPGTLASWRLLRARTFVYVAILAVVSGVMLAGLSSRSTVDLNILHDRNPLFVTLSDGAIRNGYEVRVINRGHEAATWRLSIAGLPGASLAVSGVDPNADGSADVIVPADSLLPLRVFVELPRDRAGDLAPSTPVTFTVTDAETGERFSQRNIFRGPE